MKHKIKVILIILFLLIILIFVSAQQIDYTYPPDDYWDRVLSLNQSGESMIIDNITADYFFGIYDWIIKDGDSRRYLEFNGTDLLFNESELNNTIESSEHYWNETDIESSDFLTGTINISGITNKIGIGTLTPTATLEVDGTANFTGDVTLDGGDLIVDTDNTGLELGEAQDCTFKYDGTDCVIDPNAVGSGQFQVSGEVNIVGSVGNSVDAPDVLIVTGGKGDTTDFMSNYKGADITLTTGEGGDNPIFIFGAGDGGDFTIIAGDGGDESGINQPGDGGNVYIEAGAVGTGGSGGSPGIIYIGSANNDEKIIIGQFVGPGVFSPVGIGTTDPQQKLDVNGKILARDKIAFTQTDLNEYITSLADGYLDIGATIAIRLIATSLFGGGFGSTGATIYSNGNASFDGELITIGNAFFNKTLNVINGNVGIGTKSPNDKLEVNGSIRAGEKIRILDKTGGFPALEFRNTTGDLVASIVVGTAEKIMGFGDTDAADDITINLTNGNVGIGEPNPLADLHVGGTTLLEGSGALLNVTDGTYSYLYITDANNGMVGILQSTPTVMAHIGNAQIGAMLKLEGLVGTSFAYTFDTTKGNYLELLSTNAGAIPFAIDADGKVGIGTVTPSHELNVVGSLNITENSYFDGNLTLTNTVYEDLRFPVNLIKLGATKPPAFNADNWTLDFDDGNLEQAFIIAQMPHSRKLNTNVEIHFHWQPLSGSTDNVRWCFEYSWANITGTFPTNQRECVTDAGTANTNQHLLSDAIVIDGSGKRTSSIMKIRIYRNATDAGDTYSGDAGLLEFDLHYEVDNIGSDEPNNDD